MTILTLRLALLLLSFVMVSGQSNGSNETSTSKTAPRTSLSNPVVEEHLDRFLDLINSPPPAGQLNATEYEERFVPEFVAQVPLDVFNGIVMQLQAVALDTGTTWKLVDVALDQDMVVGVVIAAVPEDGVVISMSIDADTDQVNAFLLSPQQLEDEPNTLSEAVSLLKDLGHNLNFLVANVDDNNNCQPLLGEGVDQQTPLGSMFKLWVLAAVKDAVADGAITWDQAVTVTERVKSLPSGIVQNDAVGTSRTVRELSELMISISDNTATDMLMELVGRDKVERTLWDYEHHDPSLNIPFLTTKELFLLKLHDETQDAGEFPGPSGQAYVAGNTTERRAILDQYRNTSIEAMALPLLSWTKPIAIEELEWFGSTMDICRILSALYDDNEASRIMALNPGIPDDENLWSYIGFKGGSEPGVLGLSWYLVPADSPQGNKVVTATVWDPDDAFAATTATLLIGALRDLALTNVDTMTSSGLRKFKTTTMWVVSMFAVGSLVFAAD